MVKTLTQCPYQWSQTKIIFTWWNNNAQTNGPKQTKSQNIKTMPIQMVLKQIVFTGWTSNAQTNGPKQWSFSRGVKTMVPKQWSVSRIEKTMPKLIVPHNGFSYGVTTMVQKQCSFLRTKQTMVLTQRSFCSWCFSNQLSNLRISNFHNHLNIIWSLYNAYQPLFALLQHCLIIV